MVDPIFVRAMLYQGWVMISRCPRNGLVVVITQRAVILTQLYLHGNQLAAAVLYQSLTSLHDPRAELDSLPGMMCCVYRSTDGFFFCMLG